MSRAALWKQEGKAKEREQLAQELFESAVEDGRSRGRSALPLWGNDDSFHWNPLLLRNTIHSAYFQKSCENLHDWNAIIDEIYYQVKSLVPTSVDKRPSTAFCLLLRLLCLRMTEKQLDLTLSHADSPYIRAIGFLYLRYVGVPEDVWRWIEPYLYDQEELEVEAGHRAKPITMGAFVRRLFADREYYGTTLPRYPLAVERELQAKLLAADKVAERAERHFKDQSRMRYFQTLGSQVMALYGDDENPVTWYKAIVDRVLEEDPTTGAPLKHPKFVVTFPEYGNTETVHLGEMDVEDGDWWHDRVMPSYDEIRERERSKSTADSDWARRPPAIKASLSQHSRHGVGEDRPRYRPETSKPPPQQSLQSESSPAPAKKRTAEELAAIADKKRRLMAKYG